MIASLRVLFIGGTGNISTAATRLLAESGVDIAVLTRGHSDVPLPEGVRGIRADIRDGHTVSAALRGEEFDVVVDWLAYVPAHVEADIDLFAGRISHYVFISTAMVYRKPSPFFPLVEEAPLGNDHSQYARDKIACEERLHRAHQENDFPATIVRPSYTYGESWIPAALDGQDYTIVDRMLRGKQVIVPGDGESLWTMTHNTDFARALVPILGSAAAVGEAFHITSDEVLTWNQITEAIADAAGLEPDIVHIASDFVAAVAPEFEEGLLGDKAYSAVFDNSKIKRLVPGFEAAVPLAEGLARSLAWFDADPARKVVNTERDALLDRIIAAYAAA
jgi:nucleoside-diphosphate-sugar epimerase